MTPEPTEDEYYEVPEDQRLDVDDTVPNPDADDYSAEG